jgi:hypothetical protein
MALSGASLPGLLTRALGNVGLHPIGRWRDAGLERSELRLQGTDLPLAPFIPFEMSLPFLFGERYGTDPTALAHAERSSASRIKY